MKTNSKKWLKRLGIFLGTLILIVVAASPIGDSIKSGIMEAVQKLTNALADANGVS